MRRIAAAVLAIAFLMAGCGGNDDSIMCELTEQQRSVIRSLTRVAYTIEDPEPAGSKAREDEAALLITPVGGETIPDPACSYAEAKALLATLVP